MSLYGAFDQTQHLSELNTPLVTQSGVLAPAQRKSLVRSSLGVGGYQVNGTEWFVHGNMGNSARDGRSWATSRATVASVFNDPAFASGDIIYIGGTIAEQLVTPAGVFDVAIIGLGFGNPRHTDEHTDDGGWKGAVRWKEPASGAAAGALLRVQQQGWRLENILFTPGATATVGVEFYTDAESGDSERDASHGVVNACRFSGAGIGIRFSGLPNFMGVYNSRFDNMTTGIANTVGAGAKTNSWHRYEDNWFVSNTNHMVVPLQNGIVRKNMFGVMTTLSLSLSGGGGGNIVTENVFMGDYDAGAVSASGDFWFNNYALDTSSGEVSDTTGQTTAVPAA